MDWAEFIGALAKQFGAHWVAIGVICTASGYGLFKLGGKAATLLTSVATSNNNVAIALGKIESAMRNRNDTCEHHLRNNEQLVDSVTSLVAEFHAMSESTYRTHNENIQQMMDLLNKALNGKAKP